MDVMRGEIVEAELDRLIERRSVKEPDPDEREELWQKSVRAYNARRRDEMRAAWWRVPPGPGRAAQGRSRGPDSQPRGTSREVQDLIGP